MSRKIHNYYFPLDIIILSNCKGFPESESNVFFRLHKVLLSFFLMVLNFHSAFSKISILCINLNFIYNFGTFCEPDWCKKCFLIFLFTFSGNQYYNLNALK